MIYYKSAGELQCSSLCVVSDCLIHDTTTVHAFVTTVISYIRIELPFLKRLLYFSDGAASQYKTSKILLTSVIINQIMGLMLSGIFLQLRMGRVHAMALVVQ